MTETDRPLATAHDLASYHARRERLYTAAALLLVDGSDRSVLDGRPRVDLRCGCPDSAMRASIAVDAVFPLDASVVSELRLLASLAHRIATAIDSGDLAGAAALCELQTRFLRHAGSCVFDLATRLEQVAPPHRALGTSLRRQIVDDMRLLATDVGGTSRA